MTFQTQPSPTSKPESVLISELQDALETSDCLSHNGLSQISAVARLILAKLETPLTDENAARDRDDLAHAIALIWEKAEEIKDSIHFNAEQLGCCYIDTAQYNRWTSQNLAKAAMSIHD